MPRRKTELAVALFLVLQSVALASNALVTYSVESGDVYNRYGGGAAQLGGVDWWSMFHHDLTHTGYSTSTVPNRNTTRWSYATGVSVSSSPAVADGRVFVGSDGPKVYALNASTGAFLWSYIIGHIVSSTPAVADGKVFVGSWDGNIYALNAETGAFVWSYPTGDVVTSSPVVADGKVFVGSWDGNIYALDAVTGDWIWDYSTGGPVESSPAVADGKLFVGSGDGKVYALSAATGSYVWSYTTEGYGIVSSPAVAGGSVFFGSYDSRVYALSASSGDFLWSYLTEGVVCSSPAVAGGSVFFGSWDMKIHAVNATTGAFIWSYLTEGLIDSSPAVADGKVFVGSWDNKVYALNASTGARVWSYTTGNGVYSSPSVADGKVFVGSVDGKVYAFGPPPIGDVAVTSVKPFKTCVGQGYTCRINVTVMNEMMAWDFTVTAYNDTTAIETRTVRDVWPEITLTFTWNTVGVPYGNHVLNATASLPPPQVDIDPADNSRTDAVLVTIAGDVSGNGIVNVSDLFLIGKAYSSSPSSHEWNPDIDVNDNDSVDYPDLSAASDNYGKAT